MVWKLFWAFAAANGRWWDAFSEVLRLTAALKPAAIRITLGGSFNTYNRGLSKTKPMPPYQAAAEGGIEHDDGQELRIRAGLVRTRSVLTRRRIHPLQEAQPLEGRPQPVGLPKVRVYKLSMKKKKKKKEEEGPGLPAALHPQPLHPLADREPAAGRRRGRRRCCQARCCRRAGEIAPLCTMP